MAKNSGGTRGMKSSSSSRNTNNTDKKYLSESELLSYREKLSKRYDSIEALLNNKAKKTLGQNLSLLRSFTNIVFDDKRDEDEKGKMIKTLNEMVERTYGIYKFRVKTKNKTLSKVTDEIADGYRELISVVKAMKPEKGKEYFHQQWLNGNK